MTDLINGRVSMAARTGAVASTWPVQRRISQVRMPPNSATDGDRKLPGAWLLNRLACALLGHRDLIPTGSAKYLRTGARRKLFLCHACDSYSWKSPSNSRKTVGPAFTE